MAEVSAQLEPCPETPNCVSTQAAPGGSHYLPPIALIIGPETALEIVADVLRSEARSEIVMKDARRLEATFYSRVFRFPDDIVFLINETDGLIHFRAEARYGRYDFGVNKRRMQKLSEAIRRRLVAP